MSISVVILAAGEGSRMKSSTPKVLHKISGKEMIFHIIEEALKISDDISVILGYKFDIVKSAILNKFPNIKIYKQDRENFPGTGGALKSVEIDENKKILILNGDMPLIKASILEDMINKSKEYDFTMAILNLKDPKGYGRVVIENNKVIKIVEEKDCTPKEREIKSVNSGLYLIKGEILKKYLPKISNNNKSKEYYLTDIIEMAQNDNITIFPYVTEDKYLLGVNSKYDLAVAEEIMQDDIKKELMLNGVRIINPKSVYIEKDCKIEGESIIESGAIITGKSLISNSHIKAYSIIEDSIIKNSSIGPLAHIRPHSNIINSKIGNFVETKKASLNGVKAGHLSYLGDCQIDEGSNIGAGVITCNYDGINKYETKIGKNVFVGSDSQLIAPLTIEDETFIAAGTTLTKDLPKGSLAISRAPLKFIKNFYYKFFKKEK
ncbi:MAG: bifunctional UDP-N-acetylglucosamine diphosphorylase/glucosamine-1-phosphate N-acetyltransferase GlmU [Epsilonproteobacteria bacterium]|nr:bifunctional UDP-N-acetylglucosamine diphosphorylase/glucosamine-1-phosphate N-acetyltransferase GlmU [Campylobacterota bacterium]